MPHKLLLADDSVTIQRVIELTFADEDVQVIVVGDGRQAIDRLQQDRPDIVLADIGMPGRDGYEVAAFAKGNPDFAHIPVVLLTGAFEPIDENRARSVGCDGVLVKPFEPQMVINRVKELLARPRPAAPAPAASAPAAPVPSPVPPRAMDTAAPEPAAAGPTRPAAPDHPPAAPVPALDADLGASADATERPRAEGESLEDYFDRLDAAFANLGAVSAAPPPVSPDEDLRTSLRDLHDPEPDADMTRTPAWQAARGSGPGLEPEPAPARAAAVDAPARWDVDLTDDLAGGRQPHLATAFAALLAAEEGQPLPAAALEPRTPVVGEDTIEEIVTRVIARMGDESTRQLVIETAERVVREEIDRIKRMTAAPDESHGA